MRARVALAAPLDVACRISKALSSEERAALETHAREHLGLNADDLGSPSGAAISSFISFALGAATNALTGQARMRGGLRLLVVGGGAGVIAYLIGRVLGVSV